MLTAGESRQTTDDRFLLTLPKLSADTLVQTDTLYTDDCFLLTLPKLSVDTLVQTDTLYTDDCFLLTLPKLSADTLVQTDTLYTDCEQVVPAVLALQHHGTPSPTYPDCDLAPMTHVSLVNTFNPRETLLNPPPKKKKNHVHIYTIIQC